MMHPAKDRPIHWPGAQRFCSKLCAAILNCAADVVWCMSLSSKLADALLNTAIAQDCRDVEHLVHETFKPDGAPNARIVYVGLKPEYEITYDCSALVGSLTRGRAGGKTLTTDFEKPRFFSSPSPRSSSSKMYVLQRSTAVLSPSIGTGSRAPGRGRSCSWSRCLPPRLAVRLSVVIVIACSACPRIFAQFDFPWPSSILATRTAGQSRLHAVRRCRLH